MAGERSVVTATAFSENPFRDGRYVPAFCAGISLAVRFHDACEYVRPLDLAVDYAAVAFSPLPFRSSRVPNPERSSPRAEGVPGPQLERGSHGGLHMHEAGTQ